MRPALSWRRRSSQTRGGYEYEHLKFVMNEIFGAANHVATFIWKRRTTPDSRNLNGVSGDHEYVLCYQRAAGFRVLVRCLVRLVRFFVGRETSYENILAHMEDCAPMPAKGAPDRQRFTQRCFGTG